MSFVSTKKYNKINFQSPVQTQVQQSQSQSHQQQSHHQTQTHTIQIQSSPTQIQTTSHGNRIQIQTPPQTQIRKVYPQEVGKLNIKSTLIVRFDVSFVFQVYGNGLFLNLLAHKSKCRAHRK